ncbi:hypothetical protein B0O80DRAFT_186752 [Mortierella sp. GBAus27b]|nr:hypothetical protein B0O80DRAFT_186752 [Mortierella sp. GBAus27b]
MTNPLEHPELRTAIGKFLTLRNLACCLLVSRSWYASFLPLVWQSISLRPNGKIPAMEPLSSHRHLVKHLRYFVSSWPGYESIEYPNLTSLSVNADMNGFRAALFRQRSSGDPPPDLNQFMAWRRPHQFPNLSRLKMNMINVAAANIAEFWDLCTHLTSLHLINTDVEQPPDKSITFSRLLDLNVSLKTPHPFELQVGWARQCPNLTSLRLASWMQGYQEELDEFAGSFTLNTWPELRVLQMRGLCASDKQLAQAIGSMQQATAIEVSGCEFGELSFKVLRRHFASLRTLDISKSKSVTSLMALEILTSCPQLDSLHTRRIMSQDVMESPPWVCCRSIRTLRASFMITPGQDADVQQDHVLKRLSNLVNLEFLELIGDEYDQHTKILDLRLEKGLGQLATFRRLWHLGLQNYGQRMTSIDVKVFGCILTHLCCTMSLAPSPLFVCLPN